MNIELRIAIFLEDIFVKYLSSCNANVLIKKLQEIMFFSKQFALLHAYIEFVKCAKDGNAIFGEYKSHKVPQFYLSKWI